MTVLEDVSDLITSNESKALCDDCIADKLGLSVRQHANHKTRELALMPNFDRQLGSCTSCGEEKLVIKYA